MAVLVPAHAAAIFDLGLYTPAIESPTDGVYVLAENSAGETAGGNGRAFASNGAVTTDLGVLPGGSWSAAYAISNSGFVAGYGDIGNGHFRAFVWRAAGGMTELGTLGGQDSYGMAVNDSGVVAGSATTAMGYLHAFMGTARGLTDLGTLGGAVSFAYGINDAGQVTGFSVTGDGSLHAFLAYNGTMIDLNSLLAHDSGWMLTQAFRIDNAGDIFGIGCYRGQLHNFELDPPVSVPEPCSFVLALLGLGSSTLIGKYAARR